MTEPDLIDFPAPAHCADDHGDVVFLALSIDDIRKQHGLAVVLIESAAELPSHQGMDFSILVDRNVDLQQQTYFIERVELVVKIGVRTRRLGLPRIMSLF